jgi:hypothetical protein
MSRVISRLLDQPEYQVRKIINKLEDKNGYPSHDVRLIAENVQEVRRKIAELSLDPDDTTAEELYQALLIKFQDDARRYDEYFGVQDKSYNEKAEKAAEIISRNVGLPDKWVLKKTAAKALLRQHPPRRLMKQLRYRSVDSLLKREDIAKVYLVLDSVESPAWNKAHSKQASALDSTCFERRTLKVTAISDSHLIFADSEIKSAYNSDYGVIGLLSSSSLSSASLLSLVVSLLDQLAEFTDIYASQQAAQFSPAAAWWADMDHLIAALGSQHVSFNLNDVAHNHLLGKSLGEHRLDSAQTSFWKDLLKRYGNQIQSDEDVLPQVFNLARQVSAPMNQPAFEYAEDF